MADMTKVKKGIRLFLNILFVIVVAAAIIMGWGKEVDDPDAWFPEWVEEKEEPAQTPAQAERDTRKEVSKQ
ncbi:hypothetical protein QUW23_04140 [Parasutterella secunda]|uniref:hypothetical protein n=1 Tax=Parasutterella secunda TaxID=626947 RepID=UPI0025A3CA30|nr:hypothetical protein [Parasutterella secunda]MDM8225240.1 hypothetical protein [Parasutterella secunda]